MTHGDGTLLVWADADRLALIEAVLSRVPGLKPVGLGGPRRSALAEVGERWGVGVDDDLRKLLLERPSAYLMLGGSHELAVADWQQLRQRGTSVIALDPPSSLAVLSEAWGGERGLRIMVPPSIRSSPAWQKAADPEEAVGAVRSFSLTSTGPPRDGSLYARLYAAMQVLVEGLGLPESIDAGLSGPLGAPPDDLRGLTGHLTAHLRFPAASGVIQVSDRAGEPLRQVHLLGATGELLLDDTGYRLTSDTGEVIDAARLGEHPPDTAELIAQQLRRTLELTHHPATPPQPDALSVIACCQAALLSARTHQPEHPATLLRLHRG